MTCPRGCPSLLLTLYALPPPASSSLSAVFALGSIIGLDRTYCVNDAEGATQSDLGNYCVYQGACPVHSMCRAVQSGAVLCCLLCCAVACTHTAALQAL